jgi:hypothetical protein
MSRDRKAQKKAYYESNKEAIKERVKAYKEANKEKRKAWEEANKEKRKAQRKARYEANKEKIKVQAKAWYEVNKEKRKEYKQANKEKINVTNANRRALKFRATIYLTATDKKEIENLYKLAQDKTKETGFGWHVDHIIPLTKGGLHKPTNLQVVPASWNLAKGNKTEDKYDGYY